MNASGEVSLDSLMGDIKAIPLPQLKKYVLYKTSCHNTGNVKRPTFFYSVDKASLEHLTKERIRLISSEKEEKKPVRKCICTFLEWHRPRLRPAATRLTEEGYIKGEWFYRQDGSKKSIHSTGFMQIRNIPDEEPLTTEEDKAHAACR